MTIQHILRLRTRLHKSLRRVFKHAIMRVDEDIQMGETSDNDDDLRSELNVMMMMSELDLWSRCAWR